MESVNPSYSTSNREFLDPKKKEEIESWLRDSRIVDSLDVANEIEYFDTFPTLEELEYHEWLLKYLKPSWVKANIRTGNLNNIKISCEIGYFCKRQAYIDLESPINVMSKQHYNKIMNKRLESRQKPSNPSKNNNFVGRVKGLKVFIGNFTYECNFKILEDTTSIIDHHLGEVVFGKQFSRNTGLVYDQKKGTVTFKKDDEKISFVMPHKMIDFNDINTDSIPSSVLESNDDRGKTYYLDSLTLGPEYKEDESISKKIRHLMKLEREAKRHKGEDIEISHSMTDKERYNADIRATNILLQGLPKDIYSLINHYTDTKDIWDIVKMLHEGSELTKEDRESQLYDDFKHFHQNKGETIHDYYVRFAKLINDMRNIKMTMSRMQLNSKFVNNMLPEWGRFVTAVKLNRGLRDSNYD
ncbi:protein kinase-like domain, concanavalin A-like lectin/glucanase domain protein [Tanacetum coccineum]